MEFANNVRKERNKTTECLKIVLIILNYTSVFYTALYDRRILAVHRVITFHHTCPTKLWA